MPKEPPVQGRSLNQSAIDAIATRIDSYDQAWEHRMDRLTEQVDRIANGVEEIREFIGTATEQQKAVELRIVALEEKLDSRLLQMTESISGYQEIAREQAKTTQELIRLVTAITNKFAA